MYGLARVGTLPFPLRDSQVWRASYYRHNGDLVGSFDPDSDSNNHNHSANQSRQRNEIIERSPMARLAAEEQYMTRRKLNIQNYGSTWLKPPGITKTLHQMREEKREQEEHQEALRREQLAQELAEAEAAGMPEDGMMDDVQLDGAQDLDDDIPDAEDEFGLHEDDDEEEEADDDDDDEDDDEEPSEEALREQRRNDVIARMRMDDDAFGQGLIRGDADVSDIYGGEEEIDEEDRANMLDEEDFLQHDMDDGTGMDMDADLDDDIPEAEDGGYEHTDSEAELSSSVDQDNDDDDDDEEDELDVSFAPRTAPLGPPLSPTLHGRGSFGGRLSMDLSNLLSQDGSSFMQSSPAAGRRSRYG